MAMLQLPHQVMVCFHRASVSDANFVSGRRCQFPTRLRFKNLYVKNKELGPMGWAHAGCAPFIRQCSGISDTNPFHRHPGRVPRTSASTVGTLYPLVAPRSAAHYRYLSEPGRLSQNSGWIWQVWPESIPSPSSERNSKMKICTTNEKNLNPGGSRYLRFFLFKFSAKLGNLPKFHQHSQSKHDTHRRSSIV